MAEVPSAVTRSEMFMSGDAESMPTPNTRCEKYLSAIMTGNGDTPTPVTREEKYLDELARSDGDNLSY